MQGGDRGARPQGADRADRRRGRRAGAARWSRRAKATFGRIDILVNNAGWTGNAPALDVTEEEYDRTMASSLKSVFFACQAAARVMIPQGGGKIVNIGSNFGVVAFKSPIGVRGRQGRRASSVARALARMGEAGRHRQRRRAVHHRNRVAQSDSRTARLQGMGDHADAARRADGTSRTIWWAPCCILSSHLSDMVVGHVLMVDGGWTIH